MRRKPRPDDKRPLCKCHGGNFKLPKLLPPEEDGQYAPGLCACCDAKSELIDGTRRFADVDVPLCTPHWDILDDHYLELKRIEREFEREHQQEPEVEETVEEEEKPRKTVINPRSHKLFG